MMNTLRRRILWRLPAQALSSGKERIDLPSCTFSASLSTNENSHHYYKEGILSSKPLPQSLLHKKASVRRTFAPNSNAQAMLVCGGPSLAAHASFDPEYSRAKGYIQNHPVGQGKF